MMMMMIKKKEDFLINVTKKFLWFHIKKMCFLFKKHEKLKRKNV